MYNWLFRLSKYDLHDVETLKANLRAHLYDGALFGFALSFISVNTIFPVFIERIGGSAVAIGSIPVLWTIGLNLPQALLFRFIYTTGPVKPLVMRYGLLYRLSFFLIGAFTLFAVQHSTVVVSVILLLFLLFLSAVTGSLSQPPWFVLFTKTVPVTLRGRVLAVRQILSSSLGVFGGSIVGFILAVFPFPTNFSLLFFIAFAFMMMALISVSRLKEPAITSEEHSVVDSSNFLALARKSVREDRNLRNFLFADAFTLMSMTVSVFYAVYAIQKFSLPTSYVGTFTVIFMGSMVIGNLFFGFIADSYGHKLNLMLLVGFAFSANLVAILAGNILVYGLVFFFSASTIALQGISRLSFIAELCAENERSLYIALANTITAPVVLVGVLGGILVKNFGYPLVFSFGMVTALCALLLLHRYVAEPRIRYIQAHI
jgi:MFS family permease